MNSELKDEWRDRWAILISVLQTLIIWHSTEVSSVDPCKKVHEIHELVHELLFPEVHELVGTFIF